MNTLRHRIEQSLSHNRETWANVVACTLSESELGQQYHWMSDFPDFTLWTTNNVYFVGRAADEEDYIFSVLRNPPAT